MIPDLVYLSNERRKQVATGDRIAGAPELVVEILSPGAGNERRDRHSKRQLYRKYGVKEYWIIDPRSPSIEVYRTARLKLTATLAAHDEITTPLLPGFQVLVKDIFIA
ncbi:MAG TPA: Uma2 family endonuclease [Blastocatellia bacterium]|nr:Uma2 family endonuclease [Blastocatellia bacterium]